MIMRQLLYIDLFCGAGGTSTGVERAMYEGNKYMSRALCVALYLELNQLTKH